MGTTQDNSDPIINMSEEEIINLCEQQSDSVATNTEGEKRVLEKRGRNDSNEDEEGFITVQRPPKRHARSYSINNDEFRVCIVSKELLPKQFGMAKLLRAEQIEGINTIAYKSPYKVIISFENREYGVKLMECEKLINMGYRIQPADEMFLSYGLVRQVDLEETDEEILKNIKSEFEIVSVRRLRRLTNTGEWVNSETIRLAFKSTTLPSFVFGLGCRFKVEKYTFPVTQCSGCWQYGHLVRSCPTKKIICPKCGERHDNCETDNFKCVNCKGHHMAMYKKCPIFLKEKEIREIMTDKNYTYREALKTFLAKRVYVVPDKETSEDEAGNTQGQNQARRKNYRSYRDVLVEAEIHENLTREEDDDMEGNQNLESESLNGRAKPEKYKRKEKKKNEKQSTWFEEFTGGPEIMTEHSGEEQGKKKKRYEKSFFRHLLDIFKNIMNIYKSENTMENKIELIGKLLINEFWQLIINVVQNGAVCQSIFSSLYNG